GNRSELGDLLGHRSDVNDRVAGGLAELRLWRENALGAGIGECGGLMGRRGDKSRYNGGRRSNGKPHFHAHPTPRLLSLNALSPNLSGAILGLETVFEKSAGAVLDRSAMSRWDGGKTVAPYAVASASVNPKASGRCCAGKSGAGIFGRPGLLVV